MQVFRIGARISWWHDFPTFLSVWIYSKGTSLTSWLWCIGNWRAQFIFIWKNIKRYTFLLWFLSMKCPEMQFWAWVHHQWQGRPTVYGRGDIFWQIIVNIAWCRLCSPHRLGPTKMFDIPAALNHGQFGSLIICKGALFWE